MKNAKIIYGCNADSFYASRLEMHDPYLWFQDNDGKSHILLSALEVERGRKNAKVDNVIAMDDIRTEMLDTGITPAGMGSYIEFTLKKYGIETLETPRDFPARLCLDLQKAGFELNPVNGFFWPERAIKTKDEIEAIRTTQAINQKAFEHAFNIFDEATIGKDNVLMYKGEVLTSEFIQGQMNSLNAANGCTSFNGGPIVACGEQGADPHQRGFGPLYAHQFIIIDSFPLGKNHYNGDLTRTVLKGEPTEWHTKVYEAVLKAQQVGCGTAKAGTPGPDVHKAVNESLVNDGFDTGTDEQGRPYGFFHSTGHALGLDVHDDGPGVGRAGADATLQENMVVTIEPGLYYPEKGGVRIEDIVAITKDGIDNLTTLTKEWVIK